MKLDFNAQRNEFDAIWDRRHQPPQVMDNWTLNQWAKGRTKYLVFLIHMDSQSIQEKVVETQSKLSRFRCIDPFPVEYLHLTVKELGCFLVDEKTSDDEYTWEEVEAIKTNAADILDGRLGFQVEMMRLNNFGSVVCVEGHDGGAIRELNKRLRMSLGLNNLPHDPGFLPHMSIAQYRSENQYQPMLNYLEEIREKRYGALNVNKVQLVIAHLLVTRRYPRLEVIAEYSHI